jgi:rhodanese-related sulfurtransferase
LEETLREVYPGLWVGDEESAAVIGDDYSLVIDCTGRGPTLGNGRTLPCRPTGNSNHAWSVSDLSTIVGVAGLRIEAGGTVLIHCRRGVSRSATAAAAVLLWLGEAETVNAAIGKAQVEGQRPSSHSVGGLKKWWADWSAKQQPTLF